MEGTISSFRRGRHTIHGNHMLIIVKGITDKKKAETLIGKKVIYEPEGKKNKQLIGKIVSAHGNKGVVRAIFNTGMPGQSITKKVKIE